MALRRRDDALLAISDALLTLLILGVASVIVFKGSLAPVKVAEVEQRTSDLKEVAAILGAFERATVKEARFTVDGQILVRDGEPMRQILGEAHYWATSDREVDLSNALDAIMRELRALANHRWAVSVQVVDPAAPADDPAVMCVGTTLATEPCRTDADRLTATTRIGKTMEPVAHLDVTLFAYPGVVA